MAWSSAQRVRSVTKAEEYSLRVDRLFENARTHRVMNRDVFRLGACRLANGFKVVVCLLPIALAIPVSPALADEALAIDPVLDQGVLGEGRNAYRERADASRAEDAYSIFKAHSEENPNDVAAAWHYSMACYWLGIRVYTDSEQKKAIYQEGLKAANRALSMDADCGPCHLLSAINHALWAEQVGIFRTLVGLPKVKKHLARAAELDPRFAGAAAYRVQATIYDKLPRLMGGGKRKARAALEKAIEVSPEEPLNYEMLAILLRDRFNELPRAVAVAQRGLAVPEPGEEYVESRDSFVFLQEFVNRYATQVSAR
jgi:tetratricopeptide (TPR) repeat protein